MLSFLIVLYVTMLNFLIVLYVTVLSDMQGDHEQLEEVDDDLLSSIVLPDDPPSLPAAIPTSVPDTFEFPFEPYDIQVGFMRSLYTALELGKIGIFESPTGTVSL